MSSYFQSETFQNIDFNETLFIKGEYEDCKFINCNFFSVDLSGILFNECEFIDCDLGLANLQMTAIRETKFLRCRMLGLNFENCNEFGLSFKFHGCVLDHSSFYKTNLKNTTFKECKIVGADFTESNLTSSQFDKCDLSDTIFNSTILEKADFSTSYNFYIDLEINTIKKAKFSTQGALSLLNKYEIKVVDY